MKVKNLSYNEMGTIDCEIDHPVHGWIPFTSSPGDVEPLGREIHRRAVAGEFGTIAPHQAPVPTPEQVIAEYEAELDKYLDSVAQQYRFADRTRLALRAGYPNDWQALGAAFGTWMDLCNKQAYDRKVRALAGEAFLPTLEEFLNDLPKFTYP